MVSLANVIALPWYKVLCFFTKNVHRCSWDEACELDFLLHEPTDPTNTIPFQ
jgi:hypothetical protein